MNGTDLILIQPKFRDVAEVYEPIVWKALMSKVREGDIIVDVGAFIGLYTIALAKRVGSKGKVIAFEPEPKNFLELNEHIKLNNISDRVELIQMAVGEKHGKVFFELSRSCESRILGIQNENSTSVECVTLDEIFINKRLDILKVDVEGYEEAVLKGAARLLHDPSRAPRAMFIEVHPSMWKDTGTSSESLLTLIRNYGYQVHNLDGQETNRIDSYGEIIASRVF